MIDKMQGVLYFKGNGEQKVLRQAGFELFTSISLSGRSTITLHWSIRMYVNGWQLSYIYRFAPHSWVKARAVSWCWFRVHDPHIVRSEMAFSQLFLLVMWMGVYKTEQIRYLWISPVKNEVTWTVNDARIISCYDTLFPEYAITWTLIMMMPYVNKNTAGKREFSNTGVNLLLSLLKK